MRRWARLVGAVLLIAGCAPTTAARRRAPSRVAHRPTVTVRGLDAPAARYADDVVASVSRLPIERTVLGLVESVALEAGDAAPQLDERLSIAAKVIVRGVHRLDGMPADLQLFARAQSGTVEPLQRFVFSVAHHQYFLQSGFGALRAQIADTIRREDVTHFGVGVYEDPGGVVRILAVFVLRRIDIEPFPTRLAAGASTQIGFELHEGFDTPQIYVTLPNGSVVAHEASPDGLRRFAYDLKCPEEPGLVQLEIFGSNRFGPTVLVNARVACGVEHPRTLSFELPRKSDKAPTVHEAEAALFRSINQERVQRSLPPLVADVSLATVARSHSLDMADHGFFGHISPTTGSPSDRAKKAGLAGMTAGENIGLSGTVEGLHEGLMASPGHRMLILDPNMKRVGVGAVVRTEGDQTTVWGTQLFSRPVPLESQNGETIAPDKGSPAKPAPGLDEAVRFVEKRPELGACQSLGMKREEAPGTGSDPGARVKSTLLAEAKRRKANTIFVEDRSTAERTSMVADFYQCR